MRMIICGWISALGIFILNPMLGKMGIDLSVDTDKNKKKD